MCYICVVGDVYFVQVNGFQWWMQVMELVVEQVVIVGLCGD